MIIGIFSCIRPLFTIIPAHSFKKITFILFISNFHAGEIGPHIERLLFFFYTTRTNELEMGDFLTLFVAFLSQSHPSCSSVSCMLHVVRCMLLACTVRALNVLVTNALPLPLSLESFCQCLVTSAQTTRRRAEATSVNPFFGDLACCSPVTTSPLLSNQLGSWKRLDLPRRLDAQSLPSPSNRIPDAHKGARRREDKRGREKYVIASDWKSETKNSRSVLSISPNLWRGRISPDEINRALTPACRAKKTECL